MAIQVTGKNLDLGTALRGYVVERLDKAFERYGSEGLSGHVVVEKEGAEFSTSCNIHLRSGLSLQANGRDNDPYPSVDEAMDRLEKRLRRYKRRLKSQHHGRDDATDVSAVDYVIRHSEEDEVDDTELAPAIIAETQTAVRKLSVGDAVMEMDLADKAFLFFKNASNDRLNVVYRRSDGNIGWIDPDGILGKKNDGASGTG
jgi:ribosomal subunit interface protein